MKNSVNVFNKGIFRDSTYQDQPQGTYHFMMNGNVYDVDGMANTLSSEKGNLVCAPLPENFQLIGTQLLDNNDVILYLTNNSISVIALQDCNCNYTELVRTSCFGFKEHKPISSTFRLIKGCERILYFTDGVNPVHSVNIDSLQNYLPLTVLNNTLLPTNEDKIEFANLNNSWDCDQFKLFSDMTIPCIELNSINDGGGRIEVGSHQFAIRYLDEDNNPTAWLTITQPIPVVDENLGSRYELIDGGVAGDGTQGLGGDLDLPPTNKSIILNLSNLDTSFAQYQIAVLESTSGTGVVSNVRIKPSERITSSTDVYTYVGADVLSDASGTLDEIRTSAFVINTAEHIDQIDNRLLLANTTGVQVDFAVLQRAASAITSKYIVQSGEKTNISNLSPKTPKLYFDNRSYMRDEVYAYSIVWLFTNGTESPAFHVPGRAKDTNPLTCSLIDAASATGSPIIPSAAGTAWDSTSYTFDATDANTKHLAGLNLTSFERWKAYNTAVQISPTEGLMAYYEDSNQVYPDIRDCDGNSIWGVDSCGNSLVGTPIRHHKFPDATLVPIQDEDNVHYLGVEFGNINIPAEYADIIEGYYILRGKRTETNKTVLDKGLLDRAKYFKGDPKDTTDLDVHFAYFRSDTSLDNDGLDGVSTQMYVFHSPKGYFNREFFGATHYELKQTFDMQSADIKSSQGEFDLYQFYQSGDNPNDFARTIEESKYLDHVLSQVSGEPPVGTTIGDFRVRNYLGSNHLYYSLLDDELDNILFGDRGRMSFYASIKAFRDVYSNLDSIQYIKTHNCYSTSTTIQVFGGDTFISKLDYSLQDYDASRSYMSIYVESEINSEYRHNGDTECDTYFQGDYRLDIPNPPIRLWIDRFQNTQDFIDSGAQAIEYLCHDYWALNPDFLKKNDDKVYFPLFSTFNYCRKCNETFPYRIHYSEKTFQEESTDNYRAFLVNNYNDLMGDQGAIQNMFVDKDRLFVHANKALWQIQTRPNEIQTTENTLFVGAGEFLSIPPRKLITTDYGYGGCKDKWSTVTTEHGTIFTDTSMGKVFLMGQGLTEISESGLFSYFEENLTLELPKLFLDKTSLEYPHQRYTGRFGIGVYATYDPRYSRYIFTKKDYVFTKKFGTQFKGSNATPTQNGYYWNPNTEVFFEYNGGGTRELSFLESDLFESRSFTMSFNLKQKYWVSWHSYIPSIYYNNANNFFSYIRGNNNTWEHNIGNYQTYYGTKYDFVIEYVTNEDIPNDKVYSFIEYVSRVGNYNGNDKQFIEISNTTFDKFYCYNRQQITATCDIAIKDSPYETVGHSNTVSHAARVNNAFRISKNLRDISTSINTEPLLTSDWTKTEYSSYYNVDGLGNGYIDKVPNEDVRDINKDIYQRGFMRDKFISTRLFFNPDQNYRMSFQIGMINSQDKNR